MTKKGKSFSQKLGAKITKNSLIPVLVISIFVCCTLVFHISKCWKCGKLFVEKSRVFKVFQIFNIQINRFSTFCLLVSLKCEVCAEICTFPLFTPKTAKLWHLPFFRLNFNLPLIFLIFVFAHFTKSSDTYAVLCALFA